MSFSPTKYRPALQRGLSLALVMALMLGLVAEFFGPGLSPAQAAATVTLDSAFTSGTGFSGGPFGGLVTSLALQSDGKILAIGGFTKYNNIATPQPYIARLNTDGSLDNTFSPAFTLGGPGAILQEVDALSIDGNGKIVIAYVSIVFSLGGPTPTYYVSRFNPDGTVDAAFTNATTNNVVNSIAFDSTNQVLLGGRFDMVNATTAKYLARLTNTGVLDATFTSGSNLDGLVNSVKVDPTGNVLIGGDFLNYGANSTKRIARLSNTAAFDNTFAAGTFDGTVNALAIDSNGKILVGGDFGGPTNHIARLKTDGTVDATFNIGVTGISGTTVKSLALQSDGKIIAGGNFTQSNGANRSDITRLNSDGSLDVGFDPANGFGASGTVNSLAIQTDGKILAGGAFSTYNGQGSNNIARLRLPVATNLAITGLPATATVNTPVSFTVTAQDANGATFPTYTGTVNFSSLTDPLVVFSPASYTFTPADNGVKTNLQVTFKTAGSQTVSVAPSDMSFLSTTSSSVTVSAALKGIPTVNLAVSASTVTVGQNVTLTATVTGSGATPTGTVTFSSIPAGVVTSIPGNLVNGVVSLNFSGGTPGPYSFTATYNGDSNYINNSSTPKSVTVSAATTGSYYHKLTPFRLYDDRPAGTNTPNPPLGTNAAAFKANETRTLVVNGLNGLPSTGIKAITANITIISAGPGAGFLTAFPTTDSNGVALVRPVTANLAWSNPNAASLLSNFATISVDNSGKFNVYVGVAAADVIIDVTGYYSSDSSGVGTGIYRNVDSSQKTFRLYDSRPAGTNAVAPPLGAGDGALAAGKSRSLLVASNLGIPTSASAVVVNLTAVNATGSAFFNLYPSDASQPGVASLTFIPGSPSLVGNLALVPLSADGKITLAAGGAGSADAILDVVGYVDTVFTAGSSNGLFSPLSSPTRLLDTRAKATNPIDPPLGAGLGPQQGGTANVRNFVASGKAGIPTNAIALIAQVTLVDTTGPSFIGLYGGPTWPGTVAVASAAAGQLPGNLAIIPLDSAGSFNAIFGPNASNYIIDVVGYIAGN